MLTGNFNSVNGTIPAKNIIRLNSDTTIDTSFVYGTGFNSATEAVICQSDGKLLYGGQFSSYNGNAIAAKFFTRLKTDGSIDL